MKKRKLIMTGGDLRFGRKAELRQRGLEFASVSPESVSSAQCFAWVSRQNQGPVNISRQKARAPLGLLLLGMTVAQCPTDVDSYVSSSFLVVYGGRASLVTSYPFMLKSGSLVA